MNLKKSIKKILNIKDFSLFVKKTKKRIFKNIYKKKYSANDIVHQMCIMGMKKGSTVFVHSSMTEFYNFKGNPIEIIDKILEIIGPDGTLMMPAYPKNKFKSITEINNEKIDFDVRNTPSGAGYLTEVFRNYPGVNRSINILHSVCAIGKYAYEYTKEHHLSITAWDDKSPYYKMAQNEDSLVFTLGLPNMIGTFIHCIESEFRNKYLYFSFFFKKKIIYNYLDQYGNFFSHTMYTHNLIRKADNKRIIKKYLDNNYIIESRLSNLNIKVIKVKNVYNKLLELAESGVTIFIKPSPKRYLNKNGKFIEIND